MLYDRHIDNGDRLLRRVLSYSLIAHLLLAALICWHIKSPAPPANMVVELQGVSLPAEGDGGPSGAAPPQPAPLATVAPAPQPAAPANAIPSGEQGLRPALRRSLQPTLTRAFDRVLQQPAPQQAPPGAGAAGGARGFVPYPVYRSGYGRGIRGGSSPFPNQQRRTDAAKAFMESYSASRR